MRKEKGGNAMRRLIVVTILCLTSTPALACVFNTDCKLPSSTCQDGICVGDPAPDNADDNVPTKRATGKTCFDDSDYSQGSQCVKGSGFEGVCIGH
jgi:hypothetical protein